MSLNYELGEIANWKELCYQIAEADYIGYGIKKGEKMLNPVTHALVFHTIAIGIGKITGKNAAQVYARIIAWEAMIGTSLTTISEEGKIERIPITLQDVLDHIGLTTNVFGTESASKFEKKLVNRAQEQINKHTQERVDAGHQKEGG